MKMFMPTYFMMRLTGLLVANYATGCSKVSKSNVMAAFSATSSVARMKIVSYNMHGFNQGKSLLTDLCDRYDVIFCQEH